MRRRGDAEEAAGKVFNRARKSGKGEFRSGGPTVFDLQEGAR